MSRPWLKWLAIVIGIPVLILVITDLVLTQFTIVDRSAFTELTSLQKLEVGRGYAFNGMFLTELSWEYTPPRDGHFVQRLTKELVAKGWKKMPSGPNELGPTILYAKVLRHFYPEVGKVLLEGVTPEGSVKKVAVTAQQSGMPF